MNSVVVGLVMMMHVSSANSVGYDLLGTIFGKSLIYNRKKQRSNYRTLWHTIFHFLSLRGKFI
jgi:hypothetical protein